MKRYYASMAQFKAKDGKNFGQCINQIYNKDGYTDLLIEWRTRTDGTSCIIQYWTNGNGYTIYVQE